MAIALEQAVSIIDNFLHNPEQTSKLEQAMKLVSQEGEAADLELLTEALTLIPKTSMLDPLWTRGLDQESQLEARVEALRALSGVLFAAVTILRDHNLSETTEPALISREDLIAQIDRLMEVYHDQQQQPAVRRKALEIAASLSRRKREVIKKGGHEALKSDDPSWKAAGLYVLRLTDPEKALPACRDLVEHEHPDIMHEAMQGLAELGDDTDYKRMGDLVFDSDPDRQVIYLWALAEVIGAEAGEILQDAAKWLEGEVKFEAREAFRRWNSNQPPSEPSETEASLSRLQKIIKKNAMADDWDSRFCDD